MTIDINELREDKRPQSSTIVHALLDRLEAAENDSARHKALAESALRVAKGWEDKCDALRAKIEAMERQEPARLVTPTAYRWRRRGSVMWQYGELTEKTVRLAKEHNREVQSLYTLPAHRHKEKRNETQREDPRGSARTARNQPLRPGSAKATRSTMGVCTCRNKARAERAVGVEARAC